MFIFSKLVQVVSGADGQALNVSISDDGVTIRVPVHMFGATLNFVLDTGSSFSAVDLKYKPNLREIIALQRSENVLSDNQTPIYRCPEILLKGKRLGFSEISCVDLQMLSLVSGEKCDGILGVEFFASNVVCVDFDARVLSVYSTVPDTVKNSAVCVPLKPLYRHYTVEALVNRTWAVNLLVDTGDSSSVSLNPLDWGKVFPKGQDKVVSATVASIENQVTNAMIGRIDLLTLKDYNYTNLYTYSIKNSFGPSHLGLNFFRRHRVTFDFANRTLYLQPGKTFSNPDKHDMSGLHLLRKEGITYVHSVDKDSPASQAGIENHDVIVSLDGRDTASLTMTEIREILQSGELKKVSLQIKRGDKVVRLGFVLRRII